MRRLIELAADHAATILAIQNEAVGHDVLREVIAGLLGYEGLCERQPIRLM